MFQFRLLAVCLFITALGQGAQAGGFTDFNQGLEARNRTDYDAEIAAFSRALADGDLLESMKSAALYNRGMAYQHQKKIAEAIADFSAVIKQKPDYYDAYRRRAESYQASGEVDAALADCKQLTLLNPDSAQGWAWCGRLAFTGGRYEQASSYLQHALQFGVEDRNAAYDLLWMGLTGLRMGKTAAIEMSSSLQSIDHQSWPWPLIEFFLGQIREETLQGATATGDIAARKNRQCEVGFYLGEWKLAYHDGAEAKSLFQEAVSLCPADFIELDPAKGELAKFQKGDTR